MEPVLQMIGKPESNKIAPQTRHLGEFLLPIKITRAVIEESPRNADKKLMFPRVAKVSIKLH